MEASTERTVTVLSKRDPDTKQLLLNNCNMHTDVGVIVFKDGRAENVPITVARRLIESRADVEVYENLRDDAEAPTGATTPDDLDGEVVEEPVRQPPGRPEPVSPEEEQERAKAAVDHLRAEGEEVPSELLIAAGLADAPNAIDLTPFGLTDEETNAVLNLLDEGEPQVRTYAAAAGMTTEGSIAAIAVNVLRRWQANVAANKAAREAREAAAAAPRTGPGGQADEQGGEGDGAGASQPTPDPGSANPDAPDPPGSGPQNASHAKVVPEGFEARTAEGELRCLAAKGDGTQCSNAATANSACGLEPHKKKVAALPDAPSS